MIARTSSLSPTKMLGTYAGYTLLHGNASETVVREVSGPGTLVTKIVLDAL